MPAGVPFVPFLAAARAALFAIAAGVMYGAASTLVPVLVDSAWDWWFAAALPVLALPVPALLALVLLQRAYAIGRFAVAYAALQVTDPLTAVTLGALLLGEPLPANQALAGLAVALAAAGTVALARTSPLGLTPRGSSQPDRA